MVVLGSMGGGSGCHLRGGSGGSSLGATVVAVVVVAEHLLQCPMLLFQNPCPSSCNERLRRLRLPHASNYHLRTCKQSEICFRRGRRLGQENLQEERGVGLRFEAPTSFRTEIGARIAHAF